eukprot:7866992-Heterocapsa_arctica.AAC.1
MVAKPPLVARWTRDTVTPTVDALVDAAAEPTDGQNFRAGEIASRLLDLRGVGHLPQFSGKDTEWNEWKFRFQ